MVTEAPARVPIAKQAGEVRARWAWAEPSVWTERMLAALESGVKGGKWFSLIDKVYAPGNLRSSFARVKAKRGAAGVDHQTVEMYEQHLDENLDNLGDELRSGGYQPSRIKRVWIPKPGKKELRPLGIPTVRDRVTQGALRAVLEPIFERDFAEHSYGFRPGRGCKDALRRVEALLHDGHHWVLDADLKGYFDSIPHDRLMARVEEKVSDGRVLALVRAFLQQRVLDEVKEWTPEEGTPQGAVISPLLSNIYLDPLDHRMAAAGFEMVRYADDFVVLCASEAEANAALATVREWCGQAGLTLHPDKTRIVDARERGGFDFLGYHFERGKHWPSKKSLQRIKDTIRAKTKRSNGHSLAFIIADVNRSLKGWFEYFKHSLKYTFPILDGLIRTRLRSILRRRSGWRGLAKRADQRRWPNAFFDREGLFSLTAAHRRSCQSVKR
jgi:RNA-directed DNA polymerase